MFLCSFTMTYVHLVCSNTSQSLCFVFQIVVPVLVEHVWCAYMFDMHHAEVHVLDLAYAWSRYHAHQEIYKMLLRALCDCVVCFFEGWLLNEIESWKLQYHFLADINRYLDFGILS